eukprot:COSAG04_NODE_6052_length_1421_cov_1.964448_2_plen_65_part_01
MKRLAHSRNMSLPEIWRTWYPFLAKHRIPGDDLYLGWPPGGQGFSAHLPSKGVDFKSIGEYQEMA